MPNPLWRGVPRSGTPSPKQMSRFCGSFVLVPVAGLEPARHCWRWILSPLRLPFHHTGILTERTRLCVRLRFYRHVLYRPRHYNTYKSRFQVPYSKILHPAAVYTKPPLIYADAPPAKHVCNSAQSRRRVSPERLAPPTLHRKHSATSSPEE